MNILVNCGKHGKFYFDEITGLVVNHEHLAESFGYPPISVILSDLQGTYNEYDIDDVSYLNNQGHLHHRKPKFIDTNIKCNSIVRGIGIIFTFNPYTGIVNTVDKSSDGGPVPIRVDLLSLQQRTLEMDIPIALINGILPEYEIEDVAYWYTMECYHPVRQRDVYSATKYLIQTNWWRTGGRQLLCKIGWHHWVWPLQDGDILVLGSNIPDHATCKYCNKRYKERRKI